MTDTMTCDHGDNDIRNDKGPTNHHDNATQFDTNDSCGDVILQTYFVALNNKAMCGSYSLKNETAGLLSRARLAIDCRPRRNKTVPKSRAEQNTINSGTPHGTSLGLARCVIQINAVWI